MATAATPPGTRRAVKPAPKPGVILGPADPDHFRVKVGRFHERWYHDPLDGCTVAPKWDGHVPSISTIKKASGSDWSFVALKRVAKAIDDRPDRLVGMELSERYDALKSINSRGLSVAAQRGTIVHGWFEDRMNGRELRDPRDILSGESVVHPEAITEAETYRGALESFFDTHQPELVATEFVVIRRDLHAGFGYGGTPDGIARIAAIGVAAYDLKSRGADSSHDAYPEDVAQIAAGASADYMVVEGDNGPQRAAIPAVDLALVISLKPDGFRLYPGDIDAGFAHFAAMHAWWCARRTERDAIGKPLAPRKIASPEQAAPISADAEDAAPEPEPPLPVPGQPSPDLVAIAEARRTLTERPDEGADRSGWDHQSEWDDLERRWKALDDAFRSWAANIKTNAHQHHAGFFAQHAQTERTWHLNRALVTLAEAGHDDDDVIRVLVAHVLDTDVPLMPAIGAGHALGSCNAEQAARVAWLADSLVGDTHLSIVYDDGGTPRLHPAAA